MTQPESGDGCPKCGKGATADPPGPPPAVRAKCCGGQLGKHTDRCPLRGLNRSEVSP